MESDTAMLENIYGMGGKIVVARNVKNINISGATKEYPRPREYVHYRAQNFVGRNFEMENIINLLNTDGSVGLYAIKGMGGIGKTALAAEVAFYLDDDEIYPGGILWANLGMEEPSDIARRWLGNYGYDVDHDDEQTRIMRLCTVLAEIPALIILDNARDASSVRKLRIKTERTRILITTRNQIALPGEIKALCLDELPEEEALKLLSTIAGKRTISEIDEAKKICHLCGYLPLAITLAGSQLSTNRWKTLHEYRKRLEKNRLLILSKGSEREDNVRITLDVSYDELDEHQAFVFDATSLFAGEDFSKEVIESILDQEYKDDDAIEDLVDLSLVFRTRQDRYRLHDLVRDYAVEKLISRSSYEIDVIKKRIATYFRDYIKINNSNYSLLDLERDNILGLLNWEFDENDSVESAILIDIAFFMTEYFRRRGLWKEVVKQGEKAFKLADHHGMVEAQARLATWTISWVYLHQGKLDSARKWSQIGLALYEKIGDQLGAATAARRLGMAILDSGEIDAARPFLIKALDIFKKLNAKNKVGDTLAVLGYLERKNGDFAKSEQFLDEAWKILIEIDDRKEISMVLYQKGRLATAMKNLPNANRFHRESLEIDNNLKRKPGITWNNFRLGLLEVEAGKISEGAEMLKLAVSAFEEMGVADRVNQIYSILQKIQESEEKRND